MSEILTIILLTGGAGACIPLGGAVACVRQVGPLWLQTELRHFVIAFGGGVLLGGVALVLVPEGVSSMQDSLLSAPILFSGAFVFFLVERLLGLKRRESPQLMGMILDYVPEAIALGGLVAAESDAAPMLALLIGLQNLPEGFNSFREIASINGSSLRRALVSMLFLVPLGPAAGLCGFLFLGDHDAILGAIMLFASGGIIYLIFQDIAPQSRLDKHWAPPLGAALGFCLALFGNMLIGAPH